MARAPQPRSCLARPSARWFILALVLGPSALAETQVPSFDLERLSLNPSGAGGLVVGGADLLPKGQLRTAVGVQYERDPLVLVDAQNHRLAALVGERVTTHLTAAFSVARRVELGVLLSAVASQTGSGNLGALGLSPAESFALATPWVQARTLLLDASAGAPLDLTVGAKLGLPVGTPGAFARDEGVSVVPSFGAGRVFDSKFRVSAELGAWLRPTQPLAPGDTTGGALLGPQLNLGVGATTLGESLRGELSLRAAVPLTAEPASVELMAGVRWLRGPFELFALAGPGFGHAPGTPLYRALGGIAFSGQVFSRATAEAEPGPTGPDSLEPAELALPPEAPTCLEGRRYAVADCPDLDLDSDGIPNGVDRCPTLAGERTAGGCPDADGDGTEDARDSCPKVAGPPEAHGCPDADADGVPDFEDRCPDARGPDRLHGCPERDADRDGVPDDVDNCPAEPGPKSNEGCPASRPQRVVIAPGRLTLKDKVYFDADKPTLQSSSFPLLDQVAALLIEHPELKKVVVEAHVADTGDASKAKKLSQAQAEAVVKYLVQHGAPRRQLEPRGYGSDRSIADNGGRIELVVESGGTKR